MKTKQYEKDFPQEYLDGVLSEDDDSIEFPVPDDSDDISEQWHYCPFDNDVCEEDDIVEDEIKKIEYSDTDLKYTDSMNACRDIFVSKLDKYGASWRVLRPESITDQVYIRINRIHKAMNENNTIATCIKEFKSIVNYSIISLIQIELGQSLQKYDITYTDAIDMFDKYAQKAYEMMCEKNVEYNEAWKLMRLCSYVDFILMKILRIKELEVENCSDVSVMNNVAEEINSNYYDIINYAIFALLRFN